MISVWFWIKHFSFVFVQNVGFDFGLTISILFGLFILNLDFLQGVGETFGRVTIEAMAYGLAVVGTDAGGTKEMVQHNMTGLLHSMGRSGNKELAHNLLYLLRNPDERLRLGSEGRKMVEKMYMKQHMYKRFVDVLVKCMRP